MNNNASTFQIVIIGIFIAFIVFAMLIFTGALPGFRGSGGEYGGDVLVWGTIPETDMRKQIDNLNREYKDFFKVFYEEMNPETYESNLIEALASNKGPDLFMLPSDLVYKHQNKVLKIPSSSFSQRDFRDTFIEEGEMYFIEEGVLGLPFTIDPIVMYWNRNIFSGEGISSEPKFWDEFFGIAQSITKTDTAFNISRSAVALGEFANVNNAKDILALLIMQGGNNITTGTNNIDSDSDEILIEVILADSGNSTSQPAESALRFFTEFANPVKSVYSWNRSLPNSQDMFVSEDLAIYFGYASELAGIVSRNPHLNFDVATVPQIRDNKSRLTYGNMTALAIANNSKNPQTAFNVASVMTEGSFMGELSKVLRTPPTRRDLLSGRQTDAYNSVFYDSALISNGWLDPHPEKTYTVFKNMVEGVTSGRFRIMEAVDSASSQMNRLIR